MISEAQNLTSSVLVSGTSRVVDTNSYTSLVTNASLRWNEEERIVAGTTSEPVA